MRHRSSRALVGDVRGQEKRMANRSGIAYDAPHPLIVTETDAGVFSHPDFISDCAASPFID